MSGEKWQNISAGPRQVKDLNRALSALRSEGKTQDEATGVVGGDEHTFTTMSMFGPCRDEVSALDEAIREKYAYQVTKETVRAIIADYEAALPEARKSRPTEDNRRSPKEDAELKAAQAARDAEYRAQQDAKNALLTQVMAKAPRNAKALIYAELHEDTSDPMTDYFGSRTTRTVAIGFRSSSREDFRALRAAAAQLPETAHMASDETLSAWHQARDAYQHHQDTLEHRDNHSMGAGNYLSDHGWAGSGSGWLVKSATFPCTYVQLTEDAIPDTPAQPASTSAGGSTATAGPSAPSRTIDADVLGILERAHVDGNAVKIAERLSRADYLSVNAVLAAAGGKWNRKAQAHLFPSDAAPVLAGLLEAGTFTKPQDEGWFPTPAPIVEQVMEAADLAPGMDVLEPSAGEGALAAPAAALGCAVDCVELNEARAAKIEAQGYARTVTVADFLSVTPRPVYDRVVMNPPFAKSADIAHVTHAAKFLRPDGLLIAVMAAGVTFRTDKATAGLRELVSNRGGTIDELPESAFKESGTDVRTVLVTLPAALWLVPDGRAHLLVSDGRTHGRILPAVRKDKAGGETPFYWATTPAGDMTPHQDPDGAVASLLAAKEHQPATA